MKEKTKITTIAIDEFTNEELTKFCKSNHLTKKAFIKNSLAYFQRNGVNPIIHETPKIELTKLGKRIESSIEILRGIETKTLIPNQTELLIKLEEMRELFVKLGNVQIKQNQQIERILNKGEKNDL